MDSMRLSLVLLREAASNFANSTFRVRGLLAISVIHQVGILPVQRQARSMVDLSLSSVEYNLIFDHSHLKSSLSVSTVSTP